MKWVHWWQLHFCHQGYRGISNQASDDSQGNVMEKMWRTLSKKLTQTRTESDENRYLGLFQFVDVSEGLLLQLHLRLDQLIAAQLHCQ